MLKCAGGAEKKIFFFATRCLVGQGPSCLCIQYRVGLCLVQHKLLRGSLKSAFFFFLLRIFPPSVRGSGKPFPPPTPRQDVMFGLCLVMASAGENFQNNSMCVFLTLASPCGLGEESQESGFLAEDVVSAWACVWGEMGCQALGVLWSSLPRHCDYLHILKKKSKLLKGMAFLFTASVCTFF